MAIKGHDMHSTDSTFILVDALQKLAQKAGSLCTNSVGGIHLHSLYLAYPEAVSYAPAGVSLSKCDGNTKVIREGEGGLCL